MYYATISILCLLIGYFLSKKMTSKSTSSIVRVDEKNWIVDGKCISFEKDTPLLRMQQEMEDDRKYNEYHRARVKHDSEAAIEEYQSTMKFIGESPHAKRCVNEEALSEITYLYVRYVNKMKKLDIMLVLTKEEFLIKENNPIHCGSWSHFMHMGGIYNLHNEATARYACADMGKQLREEFKAKMY